MEIDGGNAWLLEPAISLDEGIYGVVWQAEAADGHTVRGVIRFGVGDVVLAEPAVEDEGTEASGDLETELAAAEELGTGGGGGPVASIASAISNLGVIIGWGVALFVAFVALPRMTWVGHYLFRIMRIAGIVAVVGAVIDLASQLLGGSSWNLIAAALLRLLAGGALAGVPGMVNGSPFVWVLSGAVIASYALDGHTVTAGPLWLMVATDAAHVTFAAIWGGGILAPRHRIGPRAAQAKAGSEPGARRERPRRPVLSARNVLGVRGGGDRRGDGLLHPALTPARS